MAEKYQMYIDGEWCDSSSGETIDVISPVTGELLGTVPKATPEDVDRAVKAAHREKENFKFWSDVERGELVARIADELEKEAEKYAKDLTMEQGKSYYHEAYGEIIESAENLRNAKEDLIRMSGEVLYSKINGRKIFTKREPNGVYAAISPWNFPLVMPAEHIAPILVAGNTMVFKPASYTPISGVNFAKAIERAGCPKGVFNLVTGPGPTVGIQMVSHPLTNAIAFTGEDVTGKTIQDVAGLRSCLMEMGGTGPEIVCADADVVAAAKAAAYGAWMNAGQVCCSTQRVLVHKDVKKQFVEELLKTLDDVKLGDPMDKEVTMGPMNNEPVVAKVEAHIKEGVEKGAKILAGGKRAKGFPTDLYFEPTIIDNVRPGMMLHDLETFGPVIPIVEVSSNEEALKLANSTKLGLQMSVFTSSLKTAYWFQERLVAGNICINESCGFWEPHQPFGGCPGTETGYGRIGGKYTIEETTFLKTITVNFNDCF